MKYEDVVEPESPGKEQLQEWSRGLCSRSPALQNKQMIFQNLRIGLKNSTIPATKYYVKDNFVCL